MRLITSLLAMTLLAGFSTSVSAQIKSLGSDPDPNTRLLAVGNFDGQPLSGATVLYSIDDSPLRAAVPTPTLARYEMTGTGKKLEIIVEHPSFGATRLETSADYPTGWYYLVQVGPQGGRVKALAPTVLREIFEEGEIQNPVIPPPGQGCQLPDQLGHGASGVLAATSDPEPGFIVSDDFCPEDDGFLTHAVWWGAYYDFGIGLDCSPGAGDDFTITYYEDSGTGCPGPMIATFPSIPLAQKFFTGNVIAGLINEYQFQSAFHAPVAVTGGEKYWIEIVNDVSGSNCFWLWTTAPPDPGAACQSGGPTDYNLAFCVNLMIGPCQAPPAPTGDECDDFLPISGEGVHPYDNSTATTGTFDQDNFLCDEFGTTSIDNDMWFGWTAPCDGMVSVETCGQTGTDTKLAVYDGIICDPALMVDCNDDTCSLQSLVQFTAVAGNTYLIRAGNFPGAKAGPSALLITCAPMPLNNDECADRLLLGCPSMTAGSTVGMTPETAMPDCGPLADTSPGVWYSVMGDGGRFQANVCNGTATWDTKIHVWCGGCETPICVIGNDDFCGLQSSVEWDTAFGVEYLILVNGFGGDSGPFDLEILPMGANQGTPVDCTAPLTYSGVDFTSNLPNVFLQVTPADAYNQATGLTPFDRSYEPGTLVTVTAPTMWNGLPFAGWEVDGRFVLGRPTLTGVAEGSRELKAVFGERGQVQRRR